MIGLFVGSTLGSRVFNGLPVLHPGLGFFQELAQHEQCGASLSLTTKKTYKL